MKTFLTLFAVASLFLTAACNKSSDKKTGDTADENSTSSNSDGRYSLKSAIVTSKTSNSMMGGDIITILYFDDHGEKQATETKTKMEMMGQTIETHSKSITKDGVMYTWEEGQKTGSKIKLEGMKNAGNIDYKKMSKELMDSYKITKGGTATVMGKNCDVFEMNMEGMQGKYYIWDNITMKAEQSMSGMSLVTEVTDIDENASIPASTFEVPSDVTFTEMSMPTGM